MLYLLAYSIICSCMANLRKRIVSCYLIPGDSDLLRGCLCTTRVRNGWLESRSKKMPRIMESRLKMRVMSRQQRNWLILTPPSASSIQIARILAASYHTGQPAKSTDLEIFEVCWSLVEAINGLQTRTHISHLGSLYIHKYNQFTFAPPSSSHWMNVLRSRSPHVFWRYIFMDGEVDFTQTLVERFTAYHRRSFGVHRFCCFLWKVNSNHDWYKNENSFERIFQIQVLLVRVFFVVAICWGWTWWISPGMLRFVCVQSWLGRRDAGRCRDGGRLQWRGQGVPH